MISDEVEAGEKGYRLKAFRDLLANPAWKEEFAPLLDRARHDHHEGCAALRKTPAERAEHIQAYHLAEELLGYVQNRIESLAAELQQYQKAQMGDR